MCAGVLCEQEGVDAKMKPGPEAIARVIFCAVFAYSPLQFVLRSSDVRPYGQNPILCSCVSLLQVYNSFISQKFRICTSHLRVGTSTSQSIQIAAARQTPFDLLTVALVIKFFTG